MAPTEFEGWLGVDKSAVKGNMKWGKFEPKKWAEDDVDIEISHCGVCGSDMHTLSSGWMPTPYRMCMHSNNTELVADTLAQPLSLATRSSAKPSASAPTSSTSRLETAWALARKPGAT